VSVEVLPVELRGAIERLARTPVLLIASDFDGTLSPIVEDPAAARPLPEVVDVLTALAGLPDTAVALISGRALRDLAELSGLPAEVHLVGSHGSEFSGGLRLTPAAEELHARLRRELQRIIAGWDGVGLEVKPASIAVHVRRARPDVGAQVIRAVQSGPSRWDGVEVTEGKAVIELAVVRTDKGAALDVLRQRVGATATVFIGDDVTDEKAFLRLRGHDIGIKVGDGDSAASHRVADPPQVVTVLKTLLDQRRTRLDTPPGR
jgi:trehalose 6-phosphate phosphatase